MVKQRVKPPMCNDCCGARATRKPWRGKGRGDIQKHLRDTVYSQNIIYDLTLKKGENFIDSQVRKFKHLKRCHYHLRIEQKAI